MSYQIEYRPSARKELDKTDSGTRSRIREAINALANNPRPPGCKRLIGRDTWRIRVGDWRVEYKISDAKLLVTVIKAAHRSEVYRDR